MLCTSIHNTKGNNMFTVNEETSSPRRTVLFESDKPERIVKFTEAGIYKSKAEPEPVMFVDNMVDAIIEGGKEMADVLHKLGWITAKEKSKRLPPSQEFLNEEKDHVKRKILSFIDIKSRANHDSRNIIFSAIFNIADELNVTGYTYQNDAIRIARHNIFHIARSTVSKSLGVKGKRKNADGSKAAYGSTVLDQVYQDILPENASLSSVSFAGASRRFVSRRTENIKKKFQTQISSIAAFICIARIQSVDVLSGLQFSENVRKDYSIIFDIDEYGSFTFRCSKQAKELLEAAIEKSSISGIPLHRVVADSMFPTFTGSDAEALRHVIYTTIGSNHKIEEFIGWDTVANMIEGIHQSPSADKPHTKALLYLIACSAVKTYLERMNKLNNNQSGIKDIASQYTMQNRNGNIMKVPQDAVAGMWDVVEGYHRPISQREHTVALNNNQATVIAAEYERQRMLGIRSNGIVASSSRTAPTPEELEVLRQYIPQLSAVSGTPLNTPVEPPPIQNLSESSTPICVIVSSICQAPNTRPFKITRLRMIERASIALAHNQSAVALDKYTKKCQGENNVLDEVVRWNIDPKNVLRESAVAAYRNNGVSEYIYGLIKSVYPAVDSISRTYIEPFIKDICRELETPLSFHESMSKMIYNYKNQDKKANDDQSNFRSWTKETYPTPYTITTDNKTSPSNMDRDITQYTYSTQHPIRLNNPSTYRETRDEHGNIVTVSTRADNIEFNLAPINIDFSNQKRRTGRE